MSYTLTTLKSAIQDYTENTETTFVSHLRDFIRSTENRLFKMIDFEYNFESNKYEILIDKSQISRVFQNLIINSIHSIQEENLSVGKIIVKSSVANNYLNISILDNGVGLKYEKNELIKPYFTTKKGKGGSGLGLAIVEKI